MEYKDTKYVFTEFTNMSLKEGEVDINYKFSKLFETFINVPNNLENL